MAKCHVKKDDTVKVISGKDKGKTGKVLQVLPREGRLIAERINVIKRHTRPNSQNPQGGIVEREAPLPASKVMLLCPRCKRPTRIGEKILENGKVRICKKCGEVIS